MEDEEEDIVEIYRTFCAWWKLSGVPLPRFFTGSVEKTSSFEFKNLNNRQIQEKSSALIILVHCHDGQLMNCLVWLQVTGIQINSLVCGLYARASFASFNCTICILRIQEARLAFNNY